MPTESDFELELLRDSVRRFVREHYTLEKRRAARDATNLGSRQSHWHAFAENGWIGAAFDEAYGGSAGGMPQLAVLAEELGRGLVTEPFLPNLLAGLLVESLGTPAQKERCLGPLVDGFRRMALVWNPLQTSNAPTNRSMWVQRSGDGVVLTGRQAVVVGGDADVLLVIASVEGAPPESDPMCVLVPIDTLGVNTHAYRTVDDRSAADFAFDKVQLPDTALLDKSVPSARALERIFDMGATLTCSEAVGAMTLAFDTTLEYLKQRSQFGRPLGQNQALQHRMVDAQILLRECEALTRQALHAIAQSDVKARALAVSAAKAHVNLTARRISQEAIQMHGGIGTTDEALISHAFKHLMALRVLFGDTEWHQQRIAQCLDYLPSFPRPSPSSQRKQPCPCN